MIKFDKTRQTYEVIKKKQYDTLEKLTASFYSNGTALDLTEYTITLECIKQDGKIVIQDKDIIIKNANEVEVKLDPQITIIGGDSECQFVLNKGGLKDTTFTFYINVQKSVIEGGVNSSSVVTILDDLIKNIDLARKVNKETADLVASGGAATTGQVADIRESLAEITKVELVKKANQTEVNYLSSVKADKTELARVEALVGQGVTDIQLKNAVQSKVNDGTIGSIQIGENMVKTVNISDEQIIESKLSKTYKDKITTLAVSIKEDGIKEKGNVNGATWIGDELNIPRDQTGNGAYYKITLPQFKNKPLVGTKLRFSFVFDISNYSIVGTYSAEVNVKRVGVKVNGVGINKNIPSISSNSTNIITTVDYIITANDDEYIEVYFNYGMTQAVSMHRTLTIKKVYMEVVSVENQVNSSTTMFEYKTSAFLDKENSKNIFLNSPNLSDSKLENIDTKYNYYLNAKFLKDRTVQVEGVGSTGELISLKFINLKTGTQSYMVGMNGIYKIDTLNYTQIKFTTIRSAENPCEVNLIKSLIPLDIINSNFRSNNLIKMPIISKTITSDCTIKGFYQGKLYANKQLGIYESDNNGDDGFPRLIINSPASIVQLLLLDNGNIIVICKDNKMYLTTDRINWIEKMDFNKPDGLNVTPSPYFGCQHYKNIITISEYRSNKTPISGYKGFISKDYGVTWSECFDLPSETEATEGFHLHSIKYDPYGDMLWAVSGDGGKAQMVFYSIDSGLNWTKATVDLSIQATEIIPLKNCILFTSDARLVGAFRCERPKDGIRQGTKLDFELAYLVKQQWGLIMPGISVYTEVPIASTPYVDYDNSKAYFGYAILGNAKDGNLGMELKQGNIIATDGYEFQEVYKVPTGTGGVLGVYGDKDNITCSIHDNVIKGVVFDKNIFKSL